MRAGTSASLVTLHGPSPPGGGHDGNANVGLTNTSGTNINLKHAVIGIVISYLVSGNVQICFASSVRQLAAAELDSKASL
jgi:hypothetical protein